MGEKVLPVHSVAEAHLYVMLLRCRRCRRGPIKIVHQRSGNAGGAPCLRMAVRCDACGADRELAFDISAREVPAELGVSARTGWEPVNPTDRASRVIDLAQWLILFGMMREAASDQEDRHEARRVGYQAAQCLEEALKFYHADSDLPPPNAFFRAASRKRYEADPVQFTKQRLLELRSKLPTPPQTEHELAGPARGGAAERRWWQFWKR